MRPRKRWLPGAQVFLARYPGSARGFIAIDSAPIQRRYTTAADDGRLSESASTRHGRGRGPLALRLLPQDAEEDQVQHLRPLPQHGVEVPASALLLIVE